MDADFLRIFAQVAGIGGISFGVFLLIFRDVIRKNIFSNLDTDQSYRIFRLVLLLTWSIALVGISGWLYIQIFPDTRISKGVSIDSMLFSPKDAENRSFSVVINNNSDSNVVVRKMAYSRGRSSIMMRMNNICCPFCGGATVFRIAPFSMIVNNGEIATGVVPASQDGESANNFVAKVSISHGCEYPTEAQVELPVQIAVPMRSTISIKIALTDSNSLADKDKLIPLNEEIASLSTLAEPDNACVIVETDVAATLKTCKTEQSLVDSGLWFL